jgi:16S rRNA processing protein RimM
MNWDDMALVGRIARAHGIRGQVIVNVETDFPAERFRPGAELFIQRRGRIEPVRISSARFQHERPVIGVEGVATMTDAEALAGLELRVPVEWLAPLPEGSFYHHDLVGCRVETAAGDSIGEVKDVEGSAGGARLVVNGAAGEVLIPLATEICTSVDVRGKRIVVAAPEGLLELNQEQ